jgi:phage-related protein
MTDTLIPPRQPSNSGTSGNAKARTITSKFGDGWKQDSADGANAIERTQTLSWDPIISTEADTLVAFLQAHVGVPFWYTLPRDIAPRGWVWTTYDRTYPDPKFDALTISLEERYIY